MVKTINRGFIGLPLLVAILLSLFVAGGIGYVTLHQISMQNSTIDIATSTSTNTTQSLNTQNQNSQTQNSQSQNSNINTQTAGGLDIAISPTSGPVGTLVTIRGSFAKGNAVYFVPHGAKADDYSGVNASNHGTSLLIAIPAYIKFAVHCPGNVPCPMLPRSEAVTAGVYDIYVQNSAGFSNVQSFTVAGAAAAVHIDSLSPSTAPAGSTITVTGSGFSPIGNDNINIYLPNGSGFGGIKPVSFNQSGTSFTFELSSASQLPPGSYTISVNNIDTNLESNRAPFTVTAP